jgi:hypothetical protein
MGVSLSLHKDTDRSLAKSLLLNSPPSFIITTSDLPLLLLNPHSSSVYNLHTYIIYISNDPAHRRKGQ